MNTIIKYSLDELFRYLLSIAFIILSLRLLLTPEMIPSFSVFENMGNGRIMLGVFALVITLMFIIEKTKLIGGILLLLLFTYGGYLHYTTIGGIPLGLMIASGGIIFVLLMDYKRKSLKKSTS